MKPVAIHRPEDVEKLLGLRRQGVALRLGEILVREGILSREQVEKALTLQAKEGGRLGEILERLGWIKKEQLTAAMAEKLGIPAVSLRDFTPDQKALAKVPQELAVQHRVFPLALVGNRLIVAMENPLDFETIRFLEFFTGLGVEAFLALPQELDAALGKYYGQYTEEVALESLELKVSEEERAPGVISDLEKEAQKRPIVKFLNAIIMGGIVRRASDIHIHPEKDRIDILYRIDGRLLLYRSLPKSLAQGLVARTKIIGRMDIAERRLPQDGRARIPWQGREIDLRLSVIPTVHGESVVMRILDKAVGLRSLEELGLPPKEFERLKELISRPFGMFLVTGPTGSGKSTTLYAVLSRIKEGNVHILTVEDPVEYDMEGIEQVQVHADIGYTFAEALRHFLRHDPDVIMVGEIRDLETAQIGVRAALTGHLVLSTLHTNDAPSTPTRLIDMGIESYLVSTTLIGVMAQRLVRLNCPRCKAPEEVDPMIRRILKIGGDEVFYRGKGCPECNFTGYRGRTVVVELLEITPEISSLITQGASARLIRERAVAQGMTPLTENALTLARQGKTSLEEVFAVRIE